jgi:isopentenyl phosphate kinase
VTETVFLKLGGAILTDKAAIETPRSAVIERLAAEVSGWPGASAGKLVLGHGSGSYAHAAVVQSGYLEEPGDPYKLAHVAASARRLNQVVVTALLEAGLPAVPVPGSLLAVCDDGMITTIRSEIVRDLLDAALVPVLYGDAAPDRSRGGAIASTEPLFSALVDEIPASRIVLATDVGGVFPTDPYDALEEGSVEPIAVISPSTAGNHGIELSGTRPGATDVTGGMGSKVELMLKIVERHPELQVRIVSGLIPGTVLAALLGDDSSGGTTIRSDR